MQSQSVPDISNSERNFFQFIVVLSSNLLVWSHVFKTKDCHYCMTLLNKKYQFCKNNWLLIIFIALTLIVVSFHWIFKLQISKDFLGDICAFEAVLAGIAIPLSSEVISRNAERYQDLEIARIFAKEPLYRFLFVSLLLNIIIAIAFRFVDFPIPNIKIVLDLIFCWLVINTFVFYRFIKLVDDYATKPDEVFLKKLNGVIDEILRKD